MDNPFAHHKSRDTEDLPTPTKTLIFICRPEKVVESRVDELELTEEEAYELRYRLQEVISAYRERL